MAFSPAELATEEMERAEHFGRSEEADESGDTLFESAAEFPGHDLTDSEFAEIDAAEAGTGSQDIFDGNDFGDLELKAEPSELEDQTASEVQIELKSHSDREAAMSSPSYPNPDPDPAPEPSPTPDPDPESPNLPLTISDFAALEERVLRAVALVRRERQDRIAAEQRAEFAEGRVLAAESRAVAIDAELAEMKAHAPAVELLQQEVDSLRQERDQVRQRVERLLGQLDALEL